MNNITSLPDDLINEIIDTLAKQNDKKTLSVLYQTNSSLRTKIKPFVSKVLSYEQKQYNLRKLYCNVHKYRNTIACAMFTIFEICITSLVIYLLISLFVTKDKDIYMNDDGTYLFSKMSNITEFQIDFGINDTRYYYQYNIDCYSSKPGNVTKYCRKIFGETLCEYTNGGCYSNTLYCYYRDPAYYSWNIFISTEEYADYCFDKQLTNETLKYDSYNNSRIVMKNRLSINYIHEKIIGTFSPLTYETKYVVLATRIPYNPTITNNTYINKTCLCDYDNNKIKSCKDGRDMKSSSITAILVSSILMLFIIIIPLCLLIAVRCCRSNGEFNGCRMSSFHDGCIYNPNGYDLCYPRIVTIPLTKNVEVYTYKITLPLATEHTGEVGPTGYTSEV
jgi:hypothetical protein